jgi:DNA repair exonuclease SbcCD nuclease subunit
MKFIHTADWQIGKKYKTSLFPEKINDFYKFRFNSVKNILKLA